MPAQKINVNEQFYKNNRFINLFEPTLSNAFESIICSAQHLDEYKLSQVRTHLRIIKAIISE